MQEDSLMNRRNFMRLGGAGALTLSTAKLFSQVAPQKMLPPGKRTATTSPLMLRSDVLQVSFDRKDGLPVSYLLHENGAVLQGESFGRAPVAVVCNTLQWNFASVNVAVKKAEARQNKIVFHFEAQTANTRAVAFDLVYELQQATLTVTLEEVRESPGWELISVELPQLVSVTDSDTDAWLSHGDHGGSFVLLRDAREGTLPLNQFWGNIAGTLPVVMVGHKAAMCVQETTAYMDGTLLSVHKESRRSVAAMGTSKLHRVNGGACYDMNLPKGQPKNCGTRTTPNLPVGQKSSCRLDFLSVSGSVENAWLQGAELVKKRMPAMPSKMYHAAYVYGIRCDEPLYPKPSATFAECEQLIRDVNALTDGAEQIVHLWGWQFRGKDTGYPAVNEVNQRIGGYDGMMKLMAAGPAYNAKVTLSDNYDDAYRSSPAWKDELIARRPDGELWKSRSWTGEESYILGMAKYMEGPGLERVRYTCERYKLPGTTHVDVLSYFAIRNDWDRKYPASGIRNLEAGRYRVLDEFAKHGVDVSSEALRYPMIGRISNFWYAQVNGACPFGGQPIPMLPVIYRNSAIWGYSGGSQADKSIERLHELFYGACPHSILRGDISRREITDTWYLGLLPWMHLHRLQITSFERKGSTTSIGLEQNSRIEIDWEKKACNIILRGTPIADEDAVFCPINDHKMGFYSRSGRVLSTTLPAHWKPGHLVAEALYTDRKEKIPVQVDRQTIQLAVQEGVPVILRHVAG